MICSSHDIGCKDGTGPRFPLKMSAKARKARKAERKKKSLETLGFKMGSWNSRSFIVVLDALLGCCAFTIIGLRTGTGWM